MNKGNKSDTTERVPASGTAMVSCPLAGKREQEEWIFSSDFLKTIVDTARYLNCDIDMEQVDTILTILLNDRRIVGS